MSCQQLQAASVPSYEQPTLTHDGIQDVILRLGLGAESVRCDTPRVRRTLKALNKELAKHGINARVAIGRGWYFYFEGGEAEDWADRIVRVPSFQSFTLEQWIAEFERLRKLNAGMIQGGGTPAPKKPSPRRPHKK